MYVMDACALIAFLNEEPGAEVVEGIFKAVSAGDASIVMHKLNLLEVYYELFRKYGKDTADDLLELPKELPFHIQPEITDAVLQEAGRLKASYRISLAVSIALAEAVVSNSSLLTSDHHEFDVVEKSESLKFKWIR